VPYSRDFVLAKQRFRGKLLRKQPAGFVGGEGVAAGGSNSKLLSPSLTCASAAPTSSMIPSEPSTLPIRGG
jgi:hypothetical protein